MTRRDECHLVGVRAARLRPDEAAIAWATMAEELQALGDRDMPKYRDLIKAIRKATILTRANRAGMLRRLAEAIGREDVRSATDEDRRAISQNTAISASTDPRTPA